ncbi:hypothetical protein ACA910_012791 [Epithemia clementina (nom. ined.)]
MRTYVPLKLTVVSLIVTCSEGSQPPGGHASAYGRGYGNYDGGGWRGEVSGSDPQHAVSPPKQENPLPPGWSEYFDQASGQPYYHNMNDGTTTWDRPVADSTDPVPVVEDQGASSEMNSTETESAEEQTGMASLTAAPTMQSEIDRIEAKGAAEMPPGYSTHQVPEGQVVRTPEGSVLTRYATDDSTDTSHQGNEGPSNQGQLPARSSPDGPSGPGRGSQFDSQNSRQPRPWGSPQQPSQWGIDRNSPPAQESSSTSFDGPGGQGGGASDPTRQQQPPQAPSNESTGTASRSDIPASSHEQQTLAKDPKQQHGSSPEPAQGGNPVQAGRPSDPSMMPPPGRGPDSIAGMNNPRPAMQQDGPPGPQYGGPNINRAPGPPRPYQQAPFPGGQQLPPSNQQPLPEQRQPPPQGQPAQFRPLDASSGQPNAPGAPQGNQYMRQPYQQPPQPYQNQYGPPRYQQPQQQQQQQQQRPPQQMQNPPYDQYQYQQYRSYGQPQQGPPQRQLVPQEATSAVRGAIGSAWQGILGFKNRTKEAVETATSSVVNTAREASHSISSTSNNFLGQARNTFGSFFEPNTGNVGNQPPYSLSGSQGDQRPNPGRNMQGYMPPMQPGGYPYPPQQPGANYPPNQAGGNYQSQQQVGGNPYNLPPGYPPRYTSQCPGAGPPPLPGRPLPQGNPYPPGYRPPEPRGDQPYLHERNPNQGGGGGNNNNPRQPPPQRMPPQTQWNQGAQQPPQGWQGGPQMNQGGGDMQHQQRAPEKTDGQDPSEVWNHPGLNPDF